MGAVQRLAAERAVELGVAEGEHAAVGAGEPVALAVGRRGDADDRGVEVRLPSDPRKRRVPEREDAAVGAGEPVAGPPRRVPGDADDAPSSSARPDSAPSRGSAPTATTELGAGSGLRGGGADDGRIRARVASDQAGERRAALTGAATARHSVARRQPFDALRPGIASGRVMRARRCRAARSRVLGLHRKASSRRESRARPRRFCVAAWRGADSARSGGTAGEAKGTPRPPPEPDPPGIRLRIAHSN